MEAAVQEPVPDCGGGFVFAETEDLDVIDFAECYVYRQFVREVFVFLRIWNIIKRMHVPDESVLGMRQVGHVSISGIEACGCRMGVGHVTGQQEVIG